MKTQSALLAATIAVGNASTASADKRPNVVVIIADDLATSDLGCYGGVLPTPNINRLAGEGVRFTRYYSVAPVCTPSRYAILTGRIPSRAKSLLSEYPVDTPPMIRWNTEIDGEKTLGHYAKDAGYDTAYIGKWHNGCPSFSHVPYFSHPEDSWWIPVMKANYQAMQDFVRNHSGFPTVEGVYTENVIWLPVSKELMGHNQHWLTYETVRFLQKERANPFFVYHATTVPHGPPILDSLTGDPRATLLGWQNEQVNVQPSYSNILARLEANGPYPETAPGGDFPYPYSKDEAAGVLWLDDAVGRLLQELETQGTLDNTLILLASDHSRRGKMVLNEGCSPLIIRWSAGIKGGRVNDSIVSNLDFAPTLLEAIGSPVPAGMDGVSLWPILRDEKRSVRDSAYLEITYTRGIVTKDWKYIATRFPKKIKDQITPENRRTFNQEGSHASSGDPNRAFVRYSSEKRYPGYFADDQLYDLRVDPREQNNLADDPACAALLAEMKALLSTACQDLPHSFGEFKQIK